MSLTPAILAEDVEVSLDQVPIVRNANLRIGAGQIATIAGNNGSGKTTLLRAMLGLIPFQGRIELFGLPPAEFARLGRIGYVPQRGAILVQQATAREVVASGRLRHRKPFMPQSRADRQAVTAALAEVGMADQAGHPFVLLSGGQQQRVLIARALATGGDLMLWDEPLAGVDQMTQEHLATTVTRLREQGTTVVMVLHEWDPFEGLIDQVIELSGGRVVAASDQHRHGRHEVGEVGRPRAHPTGLEVG